MASLWITLLSESAADTVISGLVRRGFKVSSLGRTLVEYGEGVNWPMLALDVEFTEEVEDEDGDDTLDVLMSHLRSVIADAKLSHLGIVVEDGQTHDWAGPHVVGLQPRPEDGELKSESDERRSVYDRLRNGDTQ
jgi:hypothetical protein